MDIYDFIVKTVEEAGNIVLQASERGFETLSKGGDPRDVVTSVDIEVNNFLTKEIQSVFPGDIIYSEESPKVAYGARMWAIDPIDGSSNFSRGIPHYSVCMAQIENDEAVAGAVYNPATRELFSFRKGGGAFLNGAPIRVSNISYLKDSFVLFHAGRKPELATWGGSSYAALIGAAKKTSNLAGSALDACFVAAGRVEANIYGTLSTLDVAAAIGILTEAGGVVYTAKGETALLSSVSEKIYMANSAEGAKALIALLER